MEKNKLNTINVYKFYGSENNPTFFYSIKNSNRPVSFSYFQITLIDGVPTVTKLDNAINFLQNHQLNFKKINKEDPEYEEFVTLSSLFIRQVERPQPVTLPINRHALMKKYPNENRK